MEAPVPGPVIVYRKNFRVITATITPATTADRTSSRNCPIDITPFALLGAYSGDPPPELHLTIPFPDCANRLYGFHAIEDALATRAGLPQLFKPPRVGGGVQHRMLDTAMPQVVLDEPGIRALVRQSEPAGVTEHVRMNLDAKPRQLAVGPQ